MRLGISDSAGYGPTSSTDFWNGYTPGASGYTIYVNKVSNGPSIFSPANDTELINTAKYIATSINLSPTITTAVEAISWINSQSNMICVNYNYPSIVTSGLVALLDASFTTSYSKGGTGWRDLSDTQSTATLINGVSYLTNNNGSLSYSSSSLQYAELPDLGNLSNFTVSCWFKLSTLPTTSGAAAVVANVYDLSSKLNFSIGLNRSPTSANICGGFFNGTWRTTDGFTPATGSWYSVDVTYNGSQIIQYLNGAEQSTLTYSGTAQSSGLGIRIGRRWDSSPSSVDFINGEIPFVSIYNRALSSSEISSNYNAILPRYSDTSSIVTDGLFVELDASNYISGTWTDETGNGNNATINGATWVSTNGGIFDFDGVNDTISVPHNSSLSLSTTTQKTVQIWVKFDSLGGSNQQIPVFGKLSSASGFDGYWGGLFSNGGVLRCVTNGASIQRTSNSTLTVTTDTWYLMTFISQITSTANTTKVYINETEYITDAHGSDTYSETNPFYLGFIGSGVSSLYLNGKIGACYFYTKGLSVAEISQNYNATKSRYDGGSPVYSNLVLYYDPANTSSYPGTGTTITDLSGNGLNGTMSNITFTSPYFSYNGSSSQINIADNALLEPGSGSWTMEVWVNQSVSGNDVVLGKFDPGGLSVDVSYSIRTTGTTYYAQIGSGSGSGSTLFVNSTSYAGTIGTWAQIVYVFTNGATKTLQTFVNGSSIGTVSHSLSSILNTTSNLYIGSYNNGEYSQWFDGKIGITRLYNSALTSAQVLQNFNADKSKYGL